MKPASQRSRHLAPGDKLGKYDLIRQIAIGGMAELYLARTVGIEGFEKLVVVKRILPQHSANANFVEMFLNEARLAATLHHPNVAQVYDIGMEAGEYFFAMEYVHGEDLDEMSQQANEQGVPISMDASLTLIAGLCAGLHYAHEKVGPDGKALEIVHRDVSPSNVIVSYEGAVKLVDFGIARATKQQTTTHGGLKGKIAYMSPEQCRSSGRLDRRCDVFSIGMLLYELTTGQLPFTGETEYQLLDQIVNRDVPPPSTVVPGFPSALERIMLRALARDRDRRYPSALELQGAIEDFAHESRLRVSPLVLARLMSSLFPARLEEWAHAKAQGAFFVEQHVVRTLIEDGKTPPPNDPALRAAHEAIKAHEAIMAGADEESTSLDDPPMGDDTTVGPPPMSATEPLPTIAAPRAPTPQPAATRAPTPQPRAPTPQPRAPTPQPRAPTPQPRAPTPQPPPRTQTPPRGHVPGMPGAVPIIGAPGTLVSSSMSTQSPAGAPPMQPPMQQAMQPPMQQAMQPPWQPPMQSPMTNASAPTLMLSLPLPLPATPTPPMPVAVVSSVGDVTARVRVPRRKSDTSHVRVVQKRSPLVWVAGLVVVAGGLAAVIALHGGGGSGTTAAASAAAPATPDEPVKPEEPAKVEPAKPEVPAEAPAKPEPVKAEAPAEPEPEKAEAPAKAEAAKAEAPAKAEEPVAAPAKPAERPAARKPADTDDEPRKAVKVATKPKAPAKKAEKKSSEKKPVEVKSEPKEEKSWNTDSPFMPVRTEKR